MQLDSTQNEFSSQNHDDIRRYIEIETYWRFISVSKLYSYKNVLFHIPNLIFSRKKNKFKSRHAISFSNSIRKIVKIYLNRTWIVQPIQQSRTIKNFRWKKKRNSTGSASWVRYIKKVHLIEFNLVHIIVGLLKSTRCEQKRNAKSFGYTTLANSKCKNPLKY